MSKYYKAETQQGHSKSFYSYIKKLSEVASKQEEAALVEKNLRSLKEEFKSGTAESGPLFDGSRLYRDASQDVEGGSADMSSSERHAKEAVVRLLHAEMMGCGQQMLSSFTIHAVNLISSSYLLNKKTGYTAVRILVDPEDALYYLTVASVQRDLKSDNYLEVAAALDFVRQALRPELLEVVSGDIQQLLRYQGSRAGGRGNSDGGHPRAMVRKKVIETMHAIYAEEHFKVKRDDDAAVATGTPEDVSGGCTLQDFRQALCDQDPAVMDAALRFFSAYVSFHQSRFNALYSTSSSSPRADLALRCLQSQTDLVPSFLNILRQVIERRLPNSYDYHHTPSPWMQMRLLSMVSTLTFFSYSYDAPTGGSASNGQRASSGFRNKNTSVLLQVVEMLKETVQRADNGMYVGFAIICEVIFATARLLPVLLDYQLDHATSGKSKEDPLHNGIDNLLVLCSEAVTKFLSSKSPNVRLSGIQALCFLSQQQNLYFHYHQKASSTSAQSHHDAAGESYFQENYKRLYMPHQMQVMECLSDDVQNDFMTQKCAVTLLFSMSNADNASAIFSRLLLFIQQKRGGRSNPHSKYARNADLLLLDRLVFQTAKGCLTLIKTFARSPMWFVNALNKLMLSVPHDVVSPDEDVQLLLKLLIESEQETRGNASAKDGGLRRECVFLYYVLCGGEVPVAAGSGAERNDVLLYEEAQRVRRRYKKYVSFYTANNCGNSSSANVPEGMYRIGAWVMGEYGYLLLAHSKNNQANAEAFYLTREKLLNCLMDMFEKSKNNALHLSDEAKCWLVSSLLKVMAIPSTDITKANDAESTRREAELRQDVIELLEPFTRSRSVDLQQRCCESVRLLQNTAAADPAILQHVLPPDGNCVPASADPQLAFLGTSTGKGGNDFIQTSLRHGARPYDAQRREALVRRYAQYTHDGSRLAGSALRGSGGLKTAAYASSASQRRGAGQNTFVLNTIETGTNIAIDMPSGGGAQRFSDFTDQNFTQHTFAVGDIDGRGGASNDYAEELVLHAAGAVKRWGVNNLAQDASYDELDRAADNSAANRLGGGRDLAMPGVPTQSGSQSQLADRGASIESRFTSRDEVDGGAGQSSDVNVKKDKFMSDIFGFSKQKRKKNKPTAQTTSTAQPKERSVSAGNDIASSKKNTTTAGEDLFQTPTQAGAGASSSGRKGDKDIFDSLFSDPNGATKKADEATLHHGIDKDAAGPLALELESRKIDNIVGGQGPLTKLSNISYFVFTLTAPRSAALKNVQVHFVTPSVFSVKDMNADNKNTFRVVARNVPTSGPGGESWRKTTLEFAELQLGTAAAGSTHGAAASLSLTVAVDPESLTQLNVEDARTRPQTLQLRTSVELSRGGDQKLQQTPLHTSLPISWIDVLYPVSTRENERILHGDSEAFRQTDQDTFFATPNFGKAWGLLARGEVSATFTLPYVVASGKDPLMQRFVKDLLHKAHLGIVEVIDEEVIATAVLLDNTNPLVKSAGTPSGEYFSTELLLCHFMWDNKLKVTVRSRNKDLSLVVLQTLEERLT